MCLKGSQNIPRLCKEMIRDYDTKVDLLRMNRRKTHRKINMLRSKSDRFLVGILKF